MCEELKGAAWQGVGLHCAPDHEHSKHLGQDPLRLSVLGPEHTWARPLGPNTTRATTPTRMASGAPTPKNDA